MSLTNRMNDVIDRIRETADEYPAVVIIHNLQQSSVAYMSQRGLDFLGITWEELSKMHFDEYYARFFNLEDAKDYSPKILSYLDKNSPDEIITFFQQVYSTDIGGMKWHTTSIKILMQDDEGRPLLSLALAVPIDPHDSVAHKVDRLLEENTFLRDHYARFSQLGDRERDVLKLLALGKSSQEIAQELFISVATADTHRRNIKRKLGTTSIYELQKYARAFDLI